MTWSAGQSQASLGVAAGAAHTRGKVDPGPGPRAKPCACCLEAKGRGRNSWAQSPEGHPSPAPLLEPPFPGAVQAPRRSPPPSHGSPVTATALRRRSPGSLAWHRVLTLRSRQEALPLPSGLLGKRGEAFSGSHKLLQAASTARNPSRTARWPADSISPRDANTAGGS